MMKLYANAYKSILKTNFMLLIIAIVLLFFTFGYWLGIPVFIVSMWLFELNTPWYVQVIGVSLSVGILISLFFIPINLKVARRVAEIKDQSALSQLIRIQLTFVLLFAVSFVLVCVGFLFVNKS